MIKRIKSIKGIGRFLNVGHTELGRLSLIYGPNCYGKSTLSDIFRSIKNQNTEILKNRQSITRNGESITQEACFSFKKDNNQSEEDIFCADYKWSNSNFDFEIEVFDSRFIEDNVFTGLTISRSNKENLTNLLIGEKSVELGRQIDFLKNRSLREKTKDIGELEELLKRNLGTLDLGINLEDFIAVKKPEDIADTKSRLTEFRESFKRIKKAILEKNKILELDEPTKIVLKNPIPILEFINDSLEKKFEDINDTAYKRMKEHIQKHFASHDGAEEQWLEKGVNAYLKQNENMDTLYCPFCSQPLNTVVDLIETYKSVFSEEYENFSREVFDIIDKKYQEFNAFLTDVSSVENLINRNSLCCLRWQGYFTENIHPPLVQIDELSHKLNESTSKILSIMEGLDDKFEELIDLKKKKPFTSIKKVTEINELSSVFQEFMKILSQYNETLESFLLEISTLKSRSRNDELLRESETINDMILYLTTTIKRYELASDIDKFQLLRKEKYGIEQEITSKQEELEQKNKEFIEQNFQNTTAIFNRLGSSDFEIQTTYSRRGGQPVYEPIIKFAGMEITHDRLSYVFSDADRRALAFSIFIAKIKKKSETELKNTIIILDDPITSFDDNRISQTFIEIKNLATYGRQLIIAAHHSKFLLDIYDKLKNLSDSNLKFLEMKRDGFGSVFKPVSDPKTRLDPHAQELEKVERFIAGDPHVNASDVRRSLRPILQKEVEWRFRRNLKGISYEGVGGLVTKLKEQNAISDDTAKKLYDFNDVLQDDHHETSLDVDEDTRNLSRNIMELIFEELNPIVVS